MRLTKLANWLSDGDLEKYQQQAQQTQSQLQKAKSKLERLDRDLQQAQKELAQTQAQLQINQGFQIELGETQIKLRKVEAQIQSYKHKLFEQQKDFNQTQSQLQQTRQALIRLTQAQDWLSQLKIPVKLVDIKKTLPKRDFEVLWGFGIITPKIKSEITTGAILVKGWVLGKKAQAQTLRVLSQNETVLETPVELRRPIVIQQYPDIPTASKSGFEFSLAVTGINQEKVLSLQALLEDRTIVPLCDFVLRPQTIESKNT